MATCYGVTFGKGKRIVVTTHVGAKVLNQLEGSVFKSRALGRRTSIKSHGHLGKINVAPPKVYRELVGLSKPMNNNLNDRDNKLAGEVFPGTGPQERKFLTASTTGAQGHTFLRFGTYSVAQSLTLVRQQLSRSQKWRDGRVSDRHNNRGMVAVRVFSLWVGDHNGLRAAQVNELKGELARMTGGNVFRIKGTVIRRPRDAGRGVQSHLRVASWNVNWLGSKLTEVQGAIESVKPGVFCLQEAMFKTDRFALRWKGYDTVVMDPDTAVGNRGLVIGTRKEDGWLLNRVMENKKHTLVAMATGVRKEVQEQGVNRARAVKIAIVNVYVPHGTERRKRALRELATVIKKLQQKRSVSEVIVCGDMNCPPADVSKWGERHGVVLHRARMRGSTRFRRSSQRPVGKSPIDHILTSTRQTRGAEKQGQWPFSDHMMITLEVRMPELEKFEPPPRIDGTDWAGGADDMGNSGIWNVADLQGESLGSFIAERVWHEAEKCGRVRKAQGSKAWHSPRVHKAAQVVRKLSSNRFEALQADDALDAEDESMAQRRDADASYERLKAAKKELRRVIKVEKLENRRKELQRQVEALRDHDGQLAWREIAKLAPRKGRCSGASSNQGSAGSVFLNEEGRLEDDPSKVLTLVGSYFAKLAKDDNNTQSKNAAAWHGAFGALPVAGYFEEECDAEVTIDDVAWAVKAASNRKAPGEDGVPAEALKCARMVKDPATGEMVPNLFLRCLHGVLSSVWESGIVPDEWNVAIVVPVPKKGDMTDLNNYRGIALMHTTQKLLSMIVARRLEQIGNAKGILPREQAGFRQKQEALAQVATLTEVASRRAKAGLSTYLTFIDFEKAYDSVPHEGLLEKLRTQGIGGKLLRYIKGCYEKPCFKVRVNGRVSREVFPFERGVRQGDPASPMLFNFYIADILQGMDRFPVLGTRDPATGAEVSIPGLLYADDCVTNAASLAAAERTVAVLQRWCLRNKMKINASKCGIMKISGSAAAALERLRPIRIPGTVGDIPVVDSYTYLGVLIDKNVDIDTMASEVKSRSWKAYGRLRPYLLSRRVCMMAKIWVLRAVVAAAGLWGCPLWATRESRLQVSQSVVVKALRTATRCWGTAKEALLWNARVTDPVVSGRGQMVSAIRRWGRPQQKTWVNVMLSSAKVSVTGTPLGRILYWNKRYNPNGYDAVGLSKRSASFSDRKLSARDDSYVAKVLADPETPIHVRAQALGVQVTELLLDVLTHDPRLSRYSGVFFKAAAGVQTTLRHHAWREELFEYARSGMAARCPVCYEEESRDSLFHSLFECPNVQSVATREKHRICRVRAECEQEADVLHRIWQGEEIPYANSSAFAEGLVYFRRYRRDVILVLACGGRVIAHDSRRSWVKPQAVRYENREACAAKRNTRFAPPAVRLERLACVCRFLYDLMPLRAAMVAERLKRARAILVQGEDGEDAGGNFSDDDDEARQAE